MRPVRAMAAGVVVTGVLALALTAAVQGSRHPGTALGLGSPLAGPTTWALALQVAAAGLVALSGLVILAAPAARCSGLLLVAAGVAVALAMVPTPATTSAALFTAALAGGSAAPALVGAAAAAFPLDGTRKRWLWPVGIALSIGVGVEGLLRAALFQPGANGCFTCARNLLDAGAGPTVFTSLDGWGPRLTIAWSTAVVAVVLVRWLSSPAAVRRRSPAALCAAAVAVLSLAGGVEAATGAAEPLDRFARQLWTVQCAVMVVMAVAVAVAALSSRAVSRHLAEIALREDVDLRVLADALSASVDLVPGSGAVVDVVFPRTDGQAVDGDGRPVPEPPKDWGVVAVRRGEVTAAEVRYPPTRAGVAYRLVAAVHGAGLALERAGASTRLQAELAELAASRVRIVEASDDERRRLERDLHDGAQQRLIALSVLLRTAGRLDGGGSRYDVAADGVAGALADLRRLARGIYPATLTDSDLGVALRSLAETSPVPLTVSDELATAPAPAVARTVYQLVSRAVQEAGRVSASERGTVSAVLRQSDDAVRVAVSARVPASVAARVVEGSADRVATLGGSASTVADGDSCAIEVVLPCGW